MISPLEKFEAISRLSEQSTFMDDVFCHFEQEAAKCFLELEVSQERLIFAFEEWKKDTARVSLQEYNGAQIDQYKLAGFLCFWLRRASPIIHVSETKKSKGSAGNDILEALAEEQEIFYKYANEYFAFDVGFRICRNVEIWRKLRPGEQRRYIVTRMQFLNDICVVLKTKSVSPHGLYLVYHALFHGTH